MADLRYVGSSDNRHLFHFLADGDRPALEIYVNAKPGEDKLPIFINAVGAPLDDMQETKGLTHMTSKLDTDVDGAPLGVTPLVCINCLAGYIVPRIHTLMTRVYVPKTADVV